MTRTNPPTPPKKVDPRRWQFCEEYVANGGDQTKAALTIWPHLSQKSAEVKASRLMKDPHVHMRIRQITDRIQSIVLQREADKAKEYENRQIDVVRGLMQIAYTPITDLCQWGQDGLEIKPSAEITPAAAMTIRKIKVNKVTVAAGENTPEINKVSVELSQYDKIKALELLGQNKGMFSYTLPTEKPYAVLIPVRREPGQPLLTKKEKRNAKDV